MKIPRIHLITLPLAKPEPRRRRKRRQGRSKDREQPTFMEEFDEARRKLADA